MTRWLISARSGGRRAQIAAIARVGHDVGLHLLLRALDEGLDREARIAILDVDGKQPADVRLPDGDRDRIAEHLDARDCPVGG